MAGAGVRVFQPGEVLTAALSTPTCRIKSFAVLTMPLIGIPRSVDLVSPFSRRVASAIWMQPMNSSTTTERHG